MSVQQACATLLDTYVKRTFLLVVHTDIIKICDPGPQNN